MTSEMDKFLDGLAYCAYEQGMEIKSTRVLDDGFMEVVCNDKHDPELEMSIDFKEEGLYCGSVMFAVRTFSADEKPTLFYVSAIPYVLFGAMFCET